MVGQRSSRRRWTNTKPALAERFVDIGSNREVILRMNKVYYTYVNLFHNIM